METLFREMGPIGWSLIGLGIVWSMVWKGIALWRAARNGHLPWFIVMAIINTAGILEIIYIFRLSKTKTTLPQSH